MITTIAEFQEQVRLLKLERLENQLVQLLKPCLYVKTSRADDESELALGTSRFGGNPDLPADFRWPHYRANEPLTFIAQFRLSEIAAYKIDTVLPESGLLYFFYAEASEPWGNFEERAASAVIYVEDENTRLVRTPHPAGQGELGPVRVLPAHQATFVPGFSLPVLESGETARYDIRFESRDEDDAYWQMLEDLLRPKLRHQILGYPQSEQYSVEYECAFGSTPPDKRQPVDDMLTQAQRAQQRYQTMATWQFLFQIDSDDSLGIMWGDVGMLYVCIPKASLAGRRFEDCWTILQCG
ncbi:MAG: DUF1963 domain-containing protein [Anaerolineae bacterium]|nr:DUF1963 domain-containing protein [Anaerolineae bacterium]